MHFNVPDFQGEKWVYKNIISIQTLSVLKYHNQIYESISLTTLLMELFYSNMQVKIITNDNFCY